jgi:hypothetical protein
MDLYIISSSGFARPLDSNMLTLTFSCNRCVLQQQHVDCKIADTLLKKGTNHHTDGWDTPSKAWTRMVLHLPHTEGGFGVIFNDITKDVSFYNVL